MFLHTPEQVEIGLYTLSAAGGLICVAGKFIYSDIRERIDENNKSIKTQWDRIDMVRDAQAKFITIEKHEDSRREIFEAIKAAVQPVIEGQNRLADKIDRFIENNLK